MTKRQFICVVLVICATICLIIKCNDTAVERDRIKAENAKDIATQREEKKAERTKERWSGVNRLPFLKDKKTD